MSNTAGKRYQVFVSSTFRDLKEERKAVLNTILDMGHIPTGMEMFPATNETPLEVIERAIVDCDYYVLIIAARYGSVDEELGISFTEREYDLAVKHEKHILPFLHLDPGNLPANSADGKPKLKKMLDVFRKRVEQGPHCKYWESVSELKYNIVLAMQHATSYFPQVGWVRADQVSNQELLERQVDLQEKYDAVLAEKNRIEAKLSESQSDPFDEFAFGEDVIEITFSSSDLQSTSEVPQPKTVEWVELFLEMAKVCVPKIDEESLYGTFGKLLLSSEYPRCTISDSSFSAIRIQFLALRLIQLESETVYYPKKMISSRQFYTVRRAGDPTSPSPAPVYAQEPRQVTFWRLTASAHQLYIENAAMRPGSVRPG